MLVHNLPVADMEQLGAQYSQLSQAHPQLIMASITPFGLDGPYRDYKAYDINLAAAGGICEGLGEAGREPLTFGTPPPLPSRRRRPCYWCANGMLVPVKYPIRIYTLN